MRPKGEFLLKGLRRAGLALFAAGVIVLHPHPLNAAAGSAVPLVVGSVRDQDGAVVAGARVRALAADGHELTTGLTDASGTFALTVDSAAAIEVACRWCATARIAVNASDEPVVVLVRRFTAFDGKLSQHDLQALPYERPGDAAGLLPYIVPSSGLLPYGPSVSDRGLGRNRGLVYDDGVPAYDFSGFSGGLDNFPDRSLESLEVAPAETAFRYSNYAGGGTFALNATGEANGAAMLTTSSAAAGSGYANVGGFTPSYAISRDDADGLARQRGGVDATLPFAGGILRFGADASDTHTFAQALTSQPVRYDHLAHADFATASRRYVTTFSFGAIENQVAFPAALGNVTGGGSDFVSTFGLAHPGAITTSLHLLDERLTGQFSTPSAYSGAVGRAGDDALVLEAEGGDGPHSFDLGLDVSQVNVTLDKPGHPSTASAAGIMPSASIKSTLGKGGFGVSASASSSLRIPTLYELTVSPDPLSDHPLERGALLDAALTYDDDRRLHLETTLYHEDLNGTSTRGMTGVGASIVWQIAPLLSLRTWTMHDSAVQNNTALVAYSPYSLSRGVAWLSYDNNAAFRLDAIAARDLADKTPAATNLDGSALARISRSLSITAGTLRRNAVRHYYAGLRFLQ